MKTHATKSLIESDRPRNPEGVEPLLLIYRHGLGSRTVGNSFFIRSNEQLELR